MDLPKMMKKNKKTYKNMFLHRLEQVWMDFEELEKIRQFNVTKILSLIDCGAQSISLRILVTFFWRKKTSFRPSLGVENFFLPNFDKMFTRIPFSFAEVSASHYLYFSR